MGTNPFFDILELQPELSFFGRAGTGDPFRQHTMRQLFPQLHDEFLGALGRQILAGQTPSLRFNDFLSGLDLNNEALSRFPGARANSPFNPPTRFLF